MTTIQDFDVACVPMQLEAFVLNPAVCGTGADEDTTARIAPITQPNYTFLRLDKFLLQSDVQNHTDLHNTAPANVNPRLYDLGARPVPQPLRHRHGVYVHWLMPRFYRSGVTSSDSVSDERRNRERLKRGLKPVPVGVDGGGTDTPDFLQPPTRWIVVRKIDIDSIKPPEAKPDFASREYEAWVIESDYQWALDKIPLDRDLQTDVAPFVAGHAGSDIKINQQAEVFIGRKTPLSQWTGQENPAATPPNISLLNSGNQLFADFQMHNTNVFSVLDNFQYGPDKAPKYLDYAKADYYVFGWHWKDDVDPLWNSGKTTAHGASLDSLFMTLLGVDPTDPWLNHKSQLRILCHGAMYGVTWDHDNKPADVPADRYNARIRDHELAAVSVGTTPMDAIISYCSARKGHPDAPGDIAKLEEDILAIESLLYARDDGVEDQRKAKDKIYNWSFHRTPGGARYYFSGKDGDGTSDTQPVEPDKDSIKALKELNQAKMLLDTCAANMQQYRWDMFSLWWKYVSDSGNSGDNPNNADFLNKTTDLSKHMTNLDKRITALQDSIDKMLNPPDLKPGEKNLLKTAKPASRPVFYRGNDPTVLVGGIESGWPTDYLQKVSVRSPNQIIPPTAAFPPALLAIMNQFNKLPSVFNQPAQSLVGEWYTLRPGGGDSGTPSPGHFYPQFHDQISTDSHWRDQWGDRQPWFPLFVEWEVEYSHIPFDYWTLDDHTARLSANKLSRYGITVPSEEGVEPEPLWEALKKEQAGKGPDTRIVSGRVLILPQPSFSLAAKVGQLFQDTPPQILDQFLSQADRDDLLARIGELSYLSSPLTGLTEGLLTQAMGSHIKPENKTIDSETGETSSVIESAAINVAGLTSPNLSMIQGNSALTPYAALTNFKDDPYCPFKPVTHGQFRFRKLNIIDKFGQSLMAIDQKPRVEGLPPIYPCISDFYEPQTVTVDGKLYANTVIQDDVQQCEFLQLPPQINQNARLNADFVRRVADDEEDAAQPSVPPFIVGPPSVRVPTSARWRPATEWENPIWGWVITNFADFGVQLFLPDGTFYREVRFGGPLGALKSPKWMPFSPDDPSPTPESKQLDLLVEKLSDPEYLDGFWYMITTAQSKLNATPTSYSQFLNSIVGRPLALVNMGWSLELATQPLLNQSTKATITTPEQQLLKPVDPLDKTPYYQLQVRFGDKDAEYDGLIGYFDTVKQGSDVLNLNKIKTFFAPEKGSLKPLELLTTKNYHKFTPFWDAPFPTVPPYDSPEFQISPKAFEDKHNSHLNVFGAIIDPFTPIQAYSSFLPPVSLSLPPWSWQKAMNTMTAFLHAGPLTLPLNDVPDYDPNQLLTVKNARDMPKRDMPLPSVGPGEWSWFQPYAEPVTPAPANVGDGDGGNDDDNPPQPKFNPFGIQKTGNLNRPSFQKGPYVAVEGFLQLRNPIMMPKPDPPKQPQPQPAP